MKKKKLQLSIKYLPLIAIIIVGFLCRLYYANMVVVRGDESSYIYQSYLITKGNIPYKDFFARSTGYLFFLAIWMSIFGNSLFAVRMSSVFISTLTIFVLYILGKKTKDHKTGLAIAAFFSFTPYNWKLGSIVMTEVPVTFLTSLGIFFLTKALMNSQKSFLIYAGIVVSYSFWIRRTSAFFVFIFPLIITIYHVYHVKRFKKLPNLSSKKNLNTNLKEIFKSVIKDSFIFIATFFVLVFIVYYSFVWLTSWLYMSEVIFWGAGPVFNIHNFYESGAIESGKSLTYLSFFSMVFFILFLASYFGKFLEGTKETAYRTILPFIFVLFYYYLTPFNVPPREILTDEIFDLVVIVAFICAAFPLSLYKRLKKGFSEFKDLTFALWYLFAAFVIYEHIQYYNPLLYQIGLGLILLLFVETLVNQVFKSRTFTLFFWSDGEKQNISSTTSLHILRKLLGFIYPYRIVVLASILTCLFLYSEESIFNQQEKTFLNMSFILSFFILIFFVRFIKINSFGLLGPIACGWFSPFLVFYIYYGYNMEFYFYEFVAPVSMGAGVVFIRIIKDVPRNLNHFVKILFTIAVVSIFLSHSILINTFEQQSSRDQISPKTHSKVVDYLKKRTQEGEEIFTATFSIAVEANLNIPYNITFKTYYQRPDTFPERELLGFPTIEELMEHFLKKPVRYCVIDPLTKLYFFATHPEFENFIKEHYEIEKTVENVEIYKLQEEFVGGRGDKG